MQKFWGQKKTPPCNCQKKRECPVPGECLKKDVIYQATVTPENSDLPTENYVGLTSNTIKQRISFHYSPFKYEQHEKSTALSKHIWMLQRQNIKYKISWKVLDRAPSFCPTRGICALCTLEKYYIIFHPILASLNINEDFEPCRHKTPKLLDKTWSFLFGSEVCLILSMFVLLCALCYHFIPDDWVLSHETICSNKW